MNHSGSNTGYAADLAALERRATALSAATDAAIRTVVPDPTAVRACGRVLGLNKNLAWKLVNLAAATDIATVLSTLPGGRGWQKTIVALTQSNCDQGLVEDLREAIDALEREITERGIDRTTLTAMAAGGLDSSRSRDEYRRLREQAVLANQTLWGTAAAITGSTYLVTRSGVDDLIDILSMAWMTGLHRLTPGPKFDVHVATTAYSDTTEKAVVGRAMNEDRIPHLVDELSTSGAAEELIARTLGTHHTILFDGGGTSPMRTIRIAFADLLPKAAYIHARHPREIGTFGTSVHVPASWAVLEVLVERSIPWPDQPEVANYSQVSGAPKRNHWNDLTRLPMAETVRSGLHVDLPSELRDTRAWHQSMLTYAARTVGRSLADFRAFQVAVPFPVLSSNLMLRWALPAPR